MKAVRCVRHAGPEALVVEDLEPLVPGPGEVLVAVRAAGVNFPDALIICNRYQFKPALPFTPGGELAGTVLALGAGVQRFAVGDAVIGLVDWGAFAEQALVPAERMVAMPAGMPFDLAGAILLTYGTCHHALTDRAAMRLGETVLVLVWCAVHPCTYRSGAWAVREPVFALRGDWQQTATTRPSDARPRSRPWV